MIIGIILVILQVVFVAVVIFALREDFIVDRAADERLER